MGRLSFISILLFGVAAQSQIRSQCEKSVYVQFDSRADEVSDVEALKVATFNYLTKAGYRVFVDNVDEADFLLDFRLGGDAALMLLEKAKRRVGQDANFSSHFRLELFWTKLDERASQLLSTESFDQPFEQNQLNKALARIPTCDSDKKIYIIESVIQPHRNQIHYHFVHYENRATIMSVIISELGLELLEYSHEFGAEKPRRAVYHWSESLEFENISANAMCLVFDVEEERGWFAFGEIINHQVNFCTDSIFTHKEQLNLIMKLPNRSSPSKYHLSSDNQNFSRKLFNELGFLTDEYLAKPGYLK
ncbi:MAG: hypothetical protein AB8E15_04495 [Bdellovibrionales bacterium]